jgi:hypothetical protein
MLSKGMRAMSDDLVPIGDTLPSDDTLFDHIGKLTPDPENARQHNERNIGMLEDALKEVGAARSIVIDETGRILAGNGTVEAAAQAGITRVRVVKADGNEIIAVQRDGLTEDQKRRLALYDNRVAELADWNPDVLRQMQVDGVHFGGLFTEKEFEQLVSVEDPDVGFSPGESSTKGLRTFSIEVTPAQLEVIERAIARGKEEAMSEGDGPNANGNVLTAILSEWLRSTD